MGLLLWKNGRPLAINVVRTFFMPKLALLWLFMSVYVAACVWLLAWLNLWEWPNLKSTLLWWLTVGFTSVFEAQGLKDKKHSLHKLLRDALTLSAIILFIAELVSFPLWVEMIMLPALAFLSLFIVVGEHQSDRAGVHRVLGVLRGLQFLVGLSVLGFSYWLVADNVSEFWSLDTLREFWLPILLWLMFIPFILLLAIYMTYEEAFIHLQARPIQAPIVPYARWRAVRAFGFNIDKVRRLARDIRARDISDRLGIEEAIQEIRRLAKVERKPPIVISAEGWSPYAARLFLEDYNLETDDYHRTQWGWIADCLSVKLNDKVLSDRMSYYLAGNERAVTRLRLALDGSNQNDTTEAQRVFDERALVLLTKAFDAERAIAAFVQAQALEPGAFVTDGITVSLDRSDWGGAEHGGYVRNLIIEHPAHDADG